MSRSLSAIVLFLLAIPIFARVRVVAKYKGEIVPDAEVCFYPAVFADPFAALASSEFRCYPSGTEIAVPDKSFSMFARRGTELMTINHSIVHGSPDARQGVGTRVVALAPAVSVDAKAILGRLGKDEHLAIILGETSQSRPTVMPLQSAGGLAPLPVGVPAVPLVIRRDQPIEVGEFLKPTGGKPVELRFSNAGGRATILVRFRAIDPLAANERIPSSKLYSDAFLKLLFSQDVPLVEVIDAAGKIHESELKAVNASNLFEAVYVFRNISPGTVRIRTRGSHWQTSEQPLEVPPRQNVVTPAPVLVRLGADVHVSLENSFQLPNSAATCTPEASDKKRDTGSSVALFQCQGALNRATLTPEVLRRCTQIASEKVTGASRTPQINFDGVMPGDYLLAAKFGDRVVNLEMAHAILGSTTEIALPFVANYVTGRVNRAGKPVKAEIRFLTGTAVSDPDTGEYFALLSKPQRAYIGIQIIACDDSFAYVRTPAVDIENGARYDIEIPSNEIIVNVLEKNTGKRLEGAAVTAAIVRPGDRRWVVGQIPAEFINEQYVVGTLDEGNIVSVCARLSGYQNQCADDFAVHRGTQQVSLSLTATTHTASIRGSGYKTAFWTRADGTVTEMMAIDDDGEFHYSGEHLQEHLILVGTALLWATMPQASIGGELILTPPQMPGRTVTFKLSERNPHKTSTILLWVNDLAVPQRALFLHQRLRGQRSLMIDRTPLVVGDLPAGAEITAAEGPAPELLEGGSAAGISYLSTRRLPVVGAEMIFE